MVDWKKNLNQWQKKAVAHEGSPLLVLAGAGSGKTRVLTHRVAWLIEQKKILAEKIVLLTFTNKAAEEMKRRVGVEIGFAGTFHGFCVRILRRFGSEVGLPTNFAIYDTADAQAALKLALKNLDLDPRQNKLGALLGSISKFKNELIGYEEAETIAAYGIWGRQLIKIWREYDRLLKEYGALDFDDLLLKAVEVLSLDKVREKIREEFGWILVDEYQDTNKAQFELTKLLVSKPAQFSAVGDASQAIYSFRGADFRNMELLKKHFGNLTVLELPQNYRSTQNILDAAYEVIEKNTTHPVIRLQSGGERGERVELFEAKDEREEAAWVARKCGRYVAYGKEAAVLYRTNAQSRAFEEEFIRQGIKYRLIGGVRFYDRAEIKDVLAYLRVINNPRDEVSWQRIEKLGKRRRRAFEDWKEKAGEGLKQKRPAEIIEGVIEVSEYLKRLDKDDPVDQARMENIEELMAVAGETENLANFLETVALVQSTDEMGNDNKTQVVMMTVHAAKGLEFDSVFVVGLEEGLFPHSRSLMEKEEMEEERRLMYVAMTRARTRLHLSFAHSRLVFGGRQRHSASRFLSELPYFLIDRVGGNFGTAEEKQKIGREEIGADQFDGQKIVTDWELEKLTREDFEEIDAW